MEAQHLRLALAVEETAGVQLLRSLVQRGHDICVVFAEPRGEEEKATTWHVARELGLLVEPARKVRDVACGTALRDKGVDVLVNVYSRHIINPSVISAPRVGAFNMHPSPLPRYAGLNPGSWAIYRGEPRHGVTVHHLAAGIDTGPIAYQATFDLTPAETGLSVAARCLREGIPLVQRLLEAAAGGAERIPRIEQDLRLREYFSRQVPNDGRVRWTDTAAQIERFVRACDYGPFPSPWGVPMARWKGQEVGILRAECTGETSKAAPGTIRAGERGLCVATTDEWLALRKTKLLGVPAGTVAPMADGDTFET